MAIPETVRRCVIRWLKHLESIEFRALNSYHSVAMGFVQCQGELPLTEVRPHHVTEWIDGRTDWSACTKYQAWSRVVTCFRWNAVEGHSAINPLAGVKRPARYYATARGAEYVLPAGLAATLLAASRGRWRAFLHALLTTGARPGELANAIAANYDPADRVIIHRGDEQKGFIHKTARTKKYGPRDRVIHLDDTTLAHVAKYAGRGGLLFPSNDGGKWTGGRIAARWRRMLAVAQVVKWMARNGHDADHVIPYSCRHTWITNAIRKGTPIKVIADLTGTSAAMIERHYSHVASDRGAMRSAFLASL